MLDSTEVLRMYGYYDKSLAEQKDYSEILTDIRRIGNIWKQRRLNLSEGIVIFRTFLLSLLELSCFHACLFSILFHSKFTTHHSPPTKSSGRNLTEGRRLIKP